MRRLDYAVEAAQTFVLHFHREGFDRGMVATFGNSFRIVQGLTPSESALRSALESIACSPGDERTRLYDSIEDVITELWRYGLRTRPWLLIILTDGQDNVSSKYRRNPLGIGRYIAQRYNDDPSNFVFLIAVDGDGRVDRRALARVSDKGSFPAVAVSSFALLETVLLEIALDMSARLAGEPLDCACMSWREVARLRDDTEAPTDYAFLIDCSGSMIEPA